MTTQTPSIAIPTRRGPGRRLVLGLATAALALAVGAGLWQAGRDGGSETATPPPVAVAQPSGARSPEHTPTYYLVGSQAEAAALRELVAQLGTPPLPEVVTLLTTAEADAFVRTVGDLEGIRAGLGLPSATVVDLRPTGGPAAAGRTSPGSATERTLPGGRPVEQYPEDQRARSAAAAPAVPVTDQELYQAWQADRVAAEAARWSALGGADAPYATTPISTCESSSDGLAC